MKDIIEIQEEVVIEQDNRKVILEKGDRIRVFEGEDTKSKAREIYKAVKGKMTSMDFNTFFSKLDGGNKDFLRKVDKVLVDNDEHDLSDWLMELWGPF
jgi:hypothetical protein